MAGVTTYAGLATPICGVGSSGDPISCVDGAKSPLAYKSLSGATQNLGMFVPVCSVDSDGIPQICDLSGGSQPDLSDYLTTDSASQTYIPITQKGVASGVATLDSNGNMTSPVFSNNAAQTGALQVNGQINAQGIAYFVSSMAQVQGIISGSSKKWTLTRRAQDNYTKLNNYTGSAWSAFAFYDDGSITTNLGTVANLNADANFTASVTVPDTSTTDSTTAALNTESAAARFATSAQLSNYLKSSDAANTYLTIANAADYATLTQVASQLSSYAKSSDLNSAVQTLMPKTGGTFTGSVAAPTPATTDNSTNIATTAYVNNAFQSVEYSVQGDISTSGSSIQIPFGASGLYAKFAYTGSGSASMTFYSTTGTLSPVDIRRNSIWGGSGVETFTLDNGSVSTSGVVADSTVYTQSQDSSAYFIRIGGQVYFLTVWASNNGSRAFMGVHKMI